MLLAQKYRGIQGKAESRHNWSSDGYPELSGLKWEILDNSMPSLPSILTIIGAFSVAVAIFTSSSQPLIRFERFF
jgi:hypothetical protein